MTFSLFFDPDTSIAPIAELFSGDGVDLELCGENTRAWKVIDGKEIFLKIPTDCHYAKVSYDESILVPD